MNFYEILGVDFHASLADIKKAYWNMCKMYHPDLHGNDSQYHEAMCQINEAYETLSNVDSRMQYDMLLQKQSEQEKSQASDSNITQKPYRSDEQVYYYEDLNFSEQKEFVSFLESFMSWYIQEFEGFNSEYYYINLEKFEFIHQTEALKVKHIHYSK